MLLSRHTLPQLIPLVRGHSSMSIKNTILPSLCFASATPIVSQYQAFFLVISQTKPLGSCNEPASKRTSGFPQSRGPVTGDGILYTQPPLSVWILILQECVRLRSELEKKYLNAERESDGHLAESGSISIKAKNTQYFKIFEPLHSLELHFNIPTHHLS